MFLGVLILNERSAFQKGSSGLRASGEMRRRRCSFVKRFESSREAEEPMAAGGRLFLETY